MKIRKALVKADEGYDLLNYRSLYAKVYYKEYWKESDSLVLRYLGISEHESEANAIATIDIGFITKSMFELWNKQYTKHHKNECDKKQLSRKLIFNHLCRLY